MIDIVLAMLIATTPAKSVDLGERSAAAVKKKCDEVHGVFFQHQNYGCEFSKGIVRCDNGRCRGYPKPKSQPQFRVVPPLPQPRPWMWHDEW